MWLTTFGFLSLLQLATAQKIECSTDADCPTGNICNPTRFAKILDKSYCWEGCRTDAECPSGWECNQEDQECEVPSTSCSTDSDCGSFENTICTTFFGLYTCEHGCRSDSDCPSGQLCNDTDPKWPKCEEGFCRDDEDCGMDEMYNKPKRCIELIGSSNGKQCVTDGCRSDADCFKDEACVKWGGAYRCSSRKDCSTKGCDDGRMCVTFSPFEVHECNTCEEQEQYCDVDAFLNKMLKPFLDIGVKADTDKPMTEEEKQQTMDHYRQNAGVLATVESCQSICKEGGGGRTPNPTAAPIPSPTPMPTANPTPSPTPSPTVAPYVQKGGDSFLEFGKWRVGATKDGQFFSFCHADTKKTAVAFTMDGTLLWGSTLPADLCLWSDPGYANNAQTPINVLYGEDWIQFGDKWRLGATDLYHASIAYQNGSVKNGATAMIWRHDGLRFPGPRRDFTTWTSASAKTVKSNIAYGDKYVQFGHFRMGEIDDTHFSIWRLGTDKTAVIYRADGTIHPGNGQRTDFNHEKPVLGKLKSWNNFEGRAALDVPTQCDSVKYDTKCTACPGHWYSSCSDRVGAKSGGDYSWALGEKAESCGFLNMGCKFKCEVRFYDYGCGCMVNPHNLNGLLICKTN